MPHGSSGFAFPFQPVLVTIPIHCQDMVSANKQTLISLHCMSMQTFNKFNEKRLCERQILKGKKGRGKGNKLSGMCFSADFQSQREIHSPFGITAKMKPFWEVQCPVFQNTFRKRINIKVCGKKRKYFRKHTQLSLNTPSSHMVHTYGCDTTQTNYFPFC